MKTHLERDLHRRGTVAAVKAVAELVAGEFRQALGEFNYGLVGKTREHGVFQRVDLIAQRGVDVRVAVTEEIHPPRTHRVEITLAVKVIQPATSSTRHRNQRQRFMLLHLRARMPHGGQAAV